MPSESEKKAATLRRRSNLQWSRRGTPQTKGKGKEASTILKRRSMHILQTRFASTRRGKGESSGPQVIVTADDDDDGGDESDAAETEVVPVLENTADRSLEIGLDLPATITDITQAAGKAESTLRGIEDILPISLPGTPVAAATTALLLPAVLPPAPPLGTPNTSSSTTLPLPIVLPSTPLFLGASNAAAGIAL
ncbi:unnamed protein product [Prunus armeniaca]